MRTTSGAPTPNSFRHLNADTVSIRPATIADVAQMQSMEEQAAGAAHWTVYQYESLFSPESPARLILVSTSEVDAARVTGFVVALCLADEWEIESVVVDLPARRRGIGTSLVREVVDRACAAGAAGVILEVRESNRAARQLYEAIGFIQEYERKDYYRGPYEHAIVYRLPLQRCDKIP